MVLIANSGFEIMALYKLFQEQRLILRERVAALSDVAELSTVTKEFMQELLRNFSLQTEFNSVQRRIFPFLSDILLLTPDLLMAIALSTEPAAAEVAPPNNTNATATKFRWMDFPMAQLALEAVGPISLFLIFFTNFSVSIILVGLIWCMAIIIRYYLVAPLSVTKPMVTIEPKLSIVVNADLFMDKLGGIILDADRLFSETGITEPTVTSAKQDLNLDNSAILELLHEMLEAMHTKDADYALKLAATIPSLLKTSGILMVNFDGKNSEYFTMYPFIAGVSTNSGTIRPALVRGERLVRQGSVIVN
ncbi:hypothetical protein TI04_08985 [Achromatium sp. WMS2]|nr:hypothetical protein TI04_08985 [Achromatium sp. WMS2]